MSVFEDFKEKFRETFIEEANEQLEKIENLLIELEENPEDREIVATIFRYIHTIKGSSSMFNMSNISQFSHELETVLDQLRDSKIKVSKDLIDLVLNSRDHIKNMVNSNNDASPELLNESNRKAAFNTSLPSGFLS